MNRLCIFVLCVTLGAATDLNNLLAQTGLPPNETHPPSIGLDAVNFPSPDAAAKSDGIGGMFKKSTGIIAPAINEQSQAISVGALASGAFVGMLGTCCGIWKLQDIYHKRKANAAKQAVRDYFVTQLTQRVQDTVGCSCSDQELGEFVEDCASKRMATFVEKDTKESFWERSGHCVDVEIAKFEEELLHRARNYFTVQLTERVQDKCSGEELDKFVEDCVSKMMPVFANSNNTKEGFWEESGEWFDKRIEIVIEANTERKPNSTERHLARRFSGVLSETQANEQPPSPKSTSTRVLSEPSYRYYDPSLPSTEASILSTGNESNAKESEDGSCRQDTPDDVTSSTHEEEMVGSSPSSNTEASSPGTQGSLETGYELNISIVD